MSIVINKKSAFANKPRAVLFDIDNTLYPYDPAHEQGMQAVVEKVKQSLGFEEKVFLDAFDRAKEIVKGRLGDTASSHNRLLYMQIALELLGLKTQLYMALDLEQTYWRTFLASAELFPGAADFLQMLRRAGIATAVVTDLGAQIQFRKLIYFRLNDTFDFVVTSEEAGIEKPAAAPFELALGKLAVDPAEAIMIGDGAMTDIEGAKELGMATAQKRHAGVKVLADKRGPDLAFDDFTELAGFFAECGWLETPAGKKARKKV